MNLIANVTGHPANPDSDNLQKQPYYLYAFAFPSMSTIPKQFPLIGGLLTNKCPNCRRGFVFVHKSIFPLTTCLRLHDNCPVCTIRLKNESNNGAGINYALTVSLLFGNLLWYWPIFGMSYLDNSIYYFLITSVLVVVLVQPWLMRLARMLYLYLYVPFGSGPSVPQNPQNSSAQP